MQNWYEFTQIYISNLTFNHESIVVKTELQLLFQLSFESKVLWINFFSGELQKRELIVKKVTKVNYCLLSVQVSKKIQQKSSDWLSR